MRDLLGILGGIVLVGMVLYLLLLMFLFIAELHRSNIFRIVIHLVLVVANIWTIIAGYKFLTKIENTKGAGYAIIYLLIGVMLYMFLNIGMCIQL